MGKNRLEAFSDGVIAILITIMVLELKVPHEPTLEALLHLWPVFVAFALSFLNVAIYWVNHHNLIHKVETVSGSILWANMLLLFCISLVPFVTAWMGEHLGEAWPIVLYGLVLLLCEVAFLLLHLTIGKAGSAEIAGEPVKPALLDPKRLGRVPPTVYVAAIALAFFSPWVSLGLYVVVALAWLVPDRKGRSLYQS
jgi:uncharacterized membrane protein